MLFTLLSLFISFSVQAKTVLVSDVDDTIKISHVLNLEDAAAYSMDSDSAFLGMSALYQALKFEHPEMKFFYLSNAPDFLMEDIHTDFLNKKAFPRGTYLPKKSIYESNHKIIELRKIVKKENPDLIILVGDNGEKDILVYDQFTKELANTKIQIIQLIHEVYSIRPSADEIGRVVLKNQKGFKTSIEAALELNKNALLTDNITEKLIQYVAPELEIEPKNKFYGDLAFPYFMKCNTFQWPWQFAESPELKSIKRNTQAFCKR